MYMSYLCQIRCINLNSASRREHLCTLSTFSLLQGQMPARGLMSSMLYPAVCCLVLTTGLRFLMIATFGHATIQQFGRNISATKQLAAHDFKQIPKVCFVLCLAGDCCCSANPQCTIPCFKNLFPEPANTMVLNLLFELAQWHTFAKLQLHSESTIAAFCTAISTLGQAVWAFQ